MLGRLLGRVRSVEKKYKDPELQDSRDRLSELTEKATRIAEANGFRAYAEVLRQGGREDGKGENG